MSTTTTTSHDTGQTTSRRTTTQPTNTPTSQLERSAANRLRTTMAAVRLAFTWLGVRKTLAPEQRTTAARAFHADRELLSASKLILDTKNPAYRAVTLKTGKDCREIRRRGFVLTGLDDAGPAPRCLLNVRLVDPDELGAVDCDAIHKCRWRHRRPQTSRQNPTERIEGEAVRFTLAEMGL